MDALKDVGSTTTPVRNAKHIVKALTAIISNFGAVELAARRLLGYILM